MEISTQFLVLIPVVVGLVQVIKSLGVSSRFAPVIAVTLGIAGATLLGSLSGATIIQGIIAGLSASGLFSGTRATLEK